MSKREFDRWQEIRAELDAELLKRVMNRPEHIQDWILPFNECCGNFLEAFIFRDSAPLAPLQGGIPSLTVQGLQHIFATLYLGLTGLQRGGLSLETWHAAMTMAETAYAIGEDKTDEWELFFVQQEDNGGALMNRLHNEIAPIFGITGGSIMITTVWIPLLHAIAQATQHVVLRESERSTLIQVAQARAVVDLWSRQGDCTLSHAPNRTCAR